MPGPHDFATPYLERRYRQHCWSRWQAVKADAVLAQYRALADAAPRLASAFALAVRDSSIEAQTRRIIRKWRAFYSRRHPTPLMYLYWLLLMSQHPTILSRRKT